MRSSTANPLAPRHLNRPAVSSRRGQPVDVEFRGGIWCKIITASCELSEHLARHDIEPLSTHKHSQTLKPVDELTMYLGESLCWIRFSFAEIQTLCAAS